MIADIAPMAPSDKTENNVISFTSEGFVSERKQARATKSSAVNRLTSTRGKNRKQKSNP
jgi:hypothetical protein